MGSHRALPQMVGQRDHPYVLPGPFLQLLPDVAHADFGFRV